MLEESVDQKYKALEVGCSIGVAIFDSKIKKYEEYFGQADKAMYQSKQLSIKDECKENLASVLFVFSML